MTIRRREQGKEGRRQYMGWEKKRIKTDEWGLVDELAECMA